jgi:chromodomain-helicase-DNA-binding protein 1
MYISLCIDEPLLNNRTITEYLIKWKGLAYEDCTYETINDLTNYQHLIDNYLDREQLSSISRNKVSTALQKNKRKKFEIFEKQPNWITGGELRDYQLEGLNWLIYSW